MSSNPSTLTPYQRWYQKNKDILSARRKEQYRTDPDYKLRAITNKRRQSQRNKRVRMVPDGFYLNLQETADHLGVTVSTLREWGLKEYYPTPVKVGRERWFTQQQVELLESFRDFIADIGGRVYQRRRQQVDQQIALLKSNWV